MDLNGSSGTVGVAVNDLLNITGNLTLNGTVQVAPSFLTTAVANTTYTIATYTGTGTGLSNFLPASRAISLNTATAGSVFLTYTGASSANLKWNSTSSGAWDVVSSFNWLNLATSNADRFFQGDGVTFDDTAGVQTAITINALVNPGSTTISASSNSFTFGGTSGIGGTGVVTKSGSSAVTLGTSNSYSGGTNLLAGTINVNNAAALGTGTLAFNGSSTIDNTSGAPLTLSTNNVQAWNADFTYGGTNSLSLGTGAVTLGGNRTVTTNGAGTLTVGGVIGGAFGLTKSGPGTLQLTGANTYAGTTTITAGTLLTGANLGAAGSSVIVGSGVGSTAALNLSGGTLTNVITGTGNVLNTGVVTISGDASGFAGTWTANNQYSLNTTTSTSASANYVDNFGGNTNGFILGTTGTYNMGSLAGVVSSAVRGGNTTIPAGGQIVLSVGANGASTTYAGVIADSTTAANGSVGVIKVGTGTLTIATSATAAGLNTNYTGGTIINGGGLRVNNTIGSGTGFGPVVVNNGATLGGSGTINNSSGTVNVGNFATGTLAAGPVTVNAGGTITAGADALTTGTLTTGLQVWNSSGGYTAKVQSNTGTVGTAGVSDLLVMSSLTISSGTGASAFTVNASSPSAVQLSSGQKIIIATVTAQGSDPFAAALTAQALTLSAGSTVVAAAGDTLGLTSGQDASNASSYDLYLTDIVTAAPEPTSLLLAGLAAVPLTLGRRRRRAQGVVVRSA